MSLGEIDISVSEWDRSILIHVRRHHAVPGRIRRGALALLWARDTCLLFLAQRLSGSKIFTFRELQRQLLVLKLRLKSFSVSFSVLRALGHRDASVSLVLWFVDSVLGSFSTSVSTRAQWASSWRSLPTILCLTVYCVFSHIPVYICKQMYVNTCTYYLSRQP